MILVMGININNMAIEFAFQKHNARKEAFFTKWFSSGEPLVVIDDIENGRTLIYNIKTFELGCEWWEE
jgi:hypothetical protein